MTLAFLDRPKASLMLAGTPAAKRGRCACGQPATHLCDWKIPPRRNSHDTGTCDAPLCNACATEAADNKHLCRAHSTTWFMRPNSAACFKCGEAPTPHIFKGVRYCSTCHPDPGPHVK